ncbi:MAG: rhodanese-like domain-containing protein [Proteobacteria bacterium]|nr:rhodanese-like domain-containing protein [Pseudomonadota bacterium]
MTRFNSMMTACFMIMVLCLPATADMNLFQKEVETEKIAVKLVRDVAKGNYGLVTTDELKHLMDAKTDMVIVDTMPYEGSYKANHVPGAVQFLFPIPDMDTFGSKETDGKTQADFEKLLGPDKNKLIVVYCGFVKCTRSHNGAVWAKKLGYTNVKRYCGGIYAWKGAGFAVEEVK